MRPKACIACRQLKIRCNYAHDALHGCERCNRLDIACVFDRHYKRQKTQQRLRLAGSKASAEPREEETPQIGAADAAVGAPVGETAAAAAAEIAESSHLPGQSQLSFSRPREDGPGPRPKMLGRLQIEQSHISHWFAEYASKMHPYLPFDTDLNTEAVYDRSPFLFWVICAVACKDSRFLNPLRTEVNQRCASLFTEIDRSLDTVQGLLILCMWPLPYKTQMEDPSVRYVALATQIAHRIGIHRPGLMIEFSSKTDVLERSASERDSTWQACFVINEEVSTQQGTPSPVQMDFGLRSIGTVTVPQKMMEILVKISAMTITIHNTLAFSYQSVSGLVPAATRLNLIKSFIGEIERFESDLPQLYQATTQQSAAIAIKLLSTRLLLYSYGLTEDVEHSIDLVRIKYLTEEACQQVVRLVAGLEIAYLPQINLKIVFFAGLLMLRMSKGDDMTDRLAMTATISKVYAILDDASHHGYEVTALFKDLLRAYAALPERGTTAIMGRASMNIVYDTVWLVKKRQVEQILDGLNLDDGFFEMLF